MAIDPPYRLDPFQNIVNVHWQSSYYRRKLHFTVHESIGPNGTWVTNHYEYTYGDSTNSNGTTTPSYWIWRPEDGAPHGVRAIDIDPAAIYADGQDMASRDLAALFTIPGAHDGLNWHLDSTSFGAQGSTGIFVVTWDCWRWSGFDETLGPGDPGYVPEASYTTNPDFYYGPMTYFDLTHSNWGSPRLTP